MKNPRNTPHKIHDLFKISSVVFPSILLIFGLALVVSWGLSPGCQGEPPVENPYADCTVLSEDLVLCDGEFCNPSTGVCNHILLAD